MLKILSNMKLTESEPKSRKAKFTKDLRLYCFFLTFFLIDILTEVRIWCFAKDAEMNSA